MGEENPNIHKYVADKKIKYYFVGKFSVKLKIVFANSTVKIFTKFLATHLRFLSTHKCVATPSLRTTGLTACPGLTFRTTMRSSTFRERGAFS
jgi:hypothetical protein